MLKLILYVIGCLLFLIAFAGYIYVRLFMRRGWESELDDYYYEFEHEHPGYARYRKWCSITFGAAVVGVLMLFLAIVI